MMPKRTKPEKNRAEEMNEALGEIFETPLTEQIEEHSKKEITKPVVECTSTGCDIMDLIAGGGCPWGKIVNIIGDKSTGKTLLESELIAVAHQKYGDKLKWFYDDAEAGYSFDSKMLYDIDIVAPDDDCSDTLEDFQLNLDRQLNELKDDEYLIYVLDSFDSLTTDDELEQYEKKMTAYSKGKKPESGSYGTSKAKGMSLFFRVMKRKIKTKNCLLIVISQVRENIGVMFGAKYTRTGGKALDFYAAQIFWLAEAEKKERLGRITGVTIKIRNTKNKIGKPFRSEFVELLFDYGVDNITTNLNYLYDLKTPTGKDVGDINTKKLNWDGQEFRLKKLIQHIEENNLENELKLRVYEKWNMLEDKILSHRKRKFGEE